MNINSRPLSLNMLANVDKFAGRLGCLEVRLPWLPWLPRLPRKMPSGGGFEGDFLGCLGCLERCLRAADSREITLVAEVASKRCLRAADSRKIILAAGSPRSDRQYN